MKTPRELLLARHEAVVPCLDSVRRAVLANPPGANEVPSGSTPVTSAWREFVDGLCRLSRSRLQWAAMGAIWVLVVLLNRESPRESRPSMAGFIPPPPRQILVSIRENRQRLREWIESPAPPPVVIPQAGIPAGREEENFVHFTA